MYHTIRIKNKGTYMGYQCPVDGLVVSDLIVYVLRSMGADVEIYDPVEEARKAKEAKEQKAAKEQAVYEAELNKLMEDSTDRRIMELEAENAAKQARIDDLESTLKNDEPVVDDADIALDEAEDIIVDDPKTKVYTDEELSIMTMAELKTILVGRGHINALYDKLAPRTKDRRPDLLRKVKETQ